MHKKTHSDYHEALHRAEAAARNRDSDQFVGALRDAFARGFEPNHISSSWESLISDAGESIASLRSTAKIDSIRNPSIENPPYTPKTEYKGRALTSEVYHEYLLKQTFNPFGTNPAAGWEIERRLSELRSIGVNLHDYGRADAQTLRRFWPEVVLAITRHANTLIGNDFVEKARAKYRNDRTF